MARNIKASAAKRRRSNRVWSLLKSKFGSEKTIEPTIDDMGNYAPFAEEDEEDRYERHMKPIREAQLQAAARTVDEPKGL